MDIEWQWQQENARLRTELAFYANPINHQPRYGFYTGVRKISQVEHDGGQRAREALEELNSGFNHGKHAASE